MRLRQNHKSPLFIRKVFTGSIAWCVATATAYAELDSTPPIVDTIPPSAIVVPVENTHNTNGLPVKSLSLIGDVAPSGVTVTDDAADTTLNSTTGLAGTLGPLPPGRHLVNWKGTDQGNNSISDNQFVNILPAVNFAVDQTVVEGNAAVTVSAYLTGPAPVYPVEIPYTLSGDASGGGVDHNADIVAAAASNIITISSGTFGTTAAITISSDAISDADETIIFTLNSGALDTSRVELGSNTTHTITISETALPPVFDIIATQGGKQTRTIVTGDGNVTLATADYPSFNYDWSATDNALIPTSGTTNNVFEFDPSGLATGFYSARLTVIDSSTATSSTREFILRVDSIAPTLSDDSDTDDDGQMDDVDNDNSGDGSAGYQDSDNDGIRNFQDGVVSRSFLQAWDLSTFNPALIKNNTHIVGPITFEWSISTAASNRVFYPLLLRAEEGLKLNLGPTAFANDIYFARLDTELAKSYWGATSLAEDIQSTDGQVVDVEITGLPHAGASVFLVIPQPASLPPSDDGSIVFRVLNQYLDWQAFDTTATPADDIKTAFKDAEGYCPPPKAASYSGNLVANIECVQLHIKDGGPNDYDGQVNGVIRLLGAPFIKVASPPIDNEVPSGIFSGTIETSTQSLNRNATTQGGGASGALGYWFVLGLLGALLLSFVPSTLSAHFCRVSESVAFRIKA